MMKQEYTVDEFVKYGRDGVCRVAGITTMRSPKDNLSAKYYSLKPVADSGSTIYVPLDNEILLAKIHPVPSKTEIDAMILASKEHSIAWLPDRKERNEAFQAILASCDQAELLRMIACIYHQKLVLVGIGKKLSAADDAALKRAEKLISNEFSFVLELSSPEAVSSYIRRLLEIDDKVV